MKFKKLLLVFILLFALFIPFVSAATYPDVSTITDGDYIVAKYADGRASPHVLLVPTSSYDVCAIDYLSSGNSSISFYDNSGNKIYFARYLQNDTEWQFSNNNTELFGWSEYDDIDNNKVVVASTVNIEDRISGGFFLPLPEIAPTPEGLGGITTEMMLGLLVELKPIILGLIVLVVGFIAFRKAWNWALVTFSRG